MKQLREPKRCLKIVSVRKSALLDENEAVLKDSDIRLQGEIDTLRAILFSKVGLLEETATEANRELSQSEVRLGIA
jgi:hypothetical protein